LIRQPIKIGEFRILGIKIAECGDLGFSWKPHFDLGFGGETTHPSQEFGEANLVFHLFSLWRNFAGVCSGKSYLQVQPLRSRGKTRFGEENEVSVSFQFRARAQQYFLEVTWVR